MTPRIDELRQQLSQLNIQILELLNARTAIAVEVMEEKVAAGQPIHLPEREQDMLAQLCAVNRGPLTDETIRQVFQTLFDAGRELVSQLSESKQ